MDTNQRTWFFYMVRCKDGSLYSGITNDLEHRMEEHNRGSGAKYTRGRRPVTLVYNAQCSDVSEARKREAQIKSWPKIKREQLLMGFSLSEYTLLTKRT